eukprot:scaffold142727_cov32-Tisochrysis_lutea.AAC.3
MGSSALRAWRATSYSGLFDTLASRRGSRGDCTDGRCTGGGFVGRGIPNDDFPVGTGRSDPFFGMYGGGEGAVAVLPLVRYLNIVGFTIFCCTSFGSAGGVAIRTGARFFSTAYKARECDMIE